MATFITSDSHFHHKNILDFEARPFTSIDEMRDAMVKSWNDAVMKNDTVYHLGDFSFGDIKKWREMLNDLRGNIILIKGNHDKSKITEQALREGLISEYHPLGTIIKAEKMILNLSHYPMMIGARPRNFSIHGHLHSHDTGFTNHLNVGVDSTFAKSLKRPFGEPIEFSRMLEHLHEINPLVEAERTLLDIENGRL